MARCDHVQGQRVKRVYDLLVRRDAALKAEYEEHSSVAERVSQLDEVWARAAVL